MPSHFAYGRGTQGNGVEIGGLTIWFSYRTAVAFRWDGQLVVRRNEWGPTTGKHLNEIDGGAKGDRVDGEDFGRLLAMAMARAGERMAADLAPREVAAV